jgi:hypothetical protein
LDEVDKCIELSKENNPENEKNLCSFINGIWCNLVWKQISIKFYGIEIFFWIIINIMPFHAVHDLLEITQAQMHAINTNHISETGVGK